MFKPEMAPVLDAQGNEQHDEDDAIVKAPTGKWTLAAKTLTAWPDGKPNVVKTLRANGDRLDLGDKQIGNGSLGVLHGAIGINAYAGNEGLAFYLNAIQLKKLEVYAEADAVETDNLGDDIGMDDVDMTSASNLDV